MVWIHELASWPQFFWDAAGLAPKLAGVRYRQGRLLGRMESLGFELRREASLSTLTSDVLKSSAIEGEALNPTEVRSSLARRLGIEFGGMVPTGRDVEGIVEVMLDATQHYAEPLTAERLFGWHAALFPTGRSGMQRIAVAAWRPEAAGVMQVVSGACRDRSSVLRPSVPSFPDRDRGCRKPRRAGNLGCRLGRLERHYPAFEGRQPKCSLPVADG